jgi:myosin heavy subunit
LAQLNQSFAGGSRHSHYLTPRFNSDQIFGIQHYAGEVYYTVSSFSEKNRDSTNGDMRELIAKSTNVLLKHIVDESTKVDAANSAAASISSSVSQKGKKMSGTSSASRQASFVSKLKEDSISKQFVLSLRQLYDTLDNTEPHYVRCVKPNGHKLPDALNALECLSQLKYAGMMETIRIRQEGYSFRQFHDEFFKRYRMLVPSCGKLKQLVDSLSKTLGVSSESWHVGNTKIFIKREMSDKLERLLWLRYSTSGRLIQRNWKHSRQVKFTTVIQKYVRVVFFFSS